VKAWNRHALSASFASHKRINLFEAILAEFKIAGPKTSLVLAQGRFGMHDGRTGLRPESCWNDRLIRRNLIGLCVPSHIAYEVGAAIPTKVVESVRATMLALSYGSTASASVHFVL
jgi:hypothetical protein